MSSVYNNAKSLATLFGKMLGKGAISETSSISSYAAWCRFQTRL